VEEENFDFDAFRCQLPFHSLAFGTAALALCGMTIARVARIRARFDIPIMAFLRFRITGSRSRFKAVMARHTLVSRMAVVSFSSA
jgi:hypothetical protein